MRISVVIPCRNEVKYIQECVEAIYHSKIDSYVQLSVFVVDGMSNDGTREVVTALISRFPNLYLIDNKAQLTPFAFNLGIHQISFEFLQIIGARHIVSSNYIAECLATLQGDPQIWCVGGKLINEYINETGRVIASAMSTSFGMGLGNFRTLEKSGFTDTVTSPMYPKFVFDKIGYFDEELIRNQDDDFNYRVTNAGGKIFFHAGISLKYYVRGDFSGLWKQFFQYGYWKVYVNQKHKAVTTFRQLIPPLFVLYLILTILLNVLFFRLGILFDLPIIAYIGLALLVTNKLKKEDPELSFFDVLKTFPILHISYGLGYLKGIYEFILLKRKPSDKQKVMSR